ncbi:subtilisin-like protein [Lentinus tigrinus ALCF2SS1-7]|uniref:subtilisin-like protein n=1 Tax=Lentinus tigrinus ALCF2SS1-7 TaxID=1328758 RepID=UPI00116621A6|nr:subtilisin-like protein [Lentinus tigrinus ALCF2SS1-7]
MRFAALPFFLSLASAVNSLPGSVGDSELVIRSELPAAPKGFVPRTLAVLPDELVHLTIALPQSNVSGLHAALLEVSDPDHPNYGRHLSKAEVEQLVAPVPESVKAVTEWLNSKGVNPAGTSASGDMLHLRVPTAHANALFGANFTMYMHEDTKTTMLRTLSYAVPGHLHEHINYVYPTTQFIPPTKQAMFHSSNSRTRRTRRDAGASSCEDTMTPQCLQTMYNIPSAPATAQNNSLYVTGLGGQVASTSDLQEFLHQLRPDIEHNSFNTIPIDGSKVDTSKGTDEADFDIQYSVGLATGVPATLLTSANKSRGIILEDLIDMVDFLLAQDEAPLVLTTSYLFTEEDVGKELAQSICNAYAQLGARGTSVIFSSGDCGVAGGFLDDPASCEDKPFVPTFPSTCPYVTSVGATEGINPPVAASFTSGGFSNFFPRPSYQDGAVQTYLDRGTLAAYSGRYNAAGRAYPDVSAHGVDYLYNLGGDFAYAYGTSTSTPAFASLVALLNDRLLNVGKAPLGFLNPLLYSRGAGAFTDVTSGSNPGCGTDGFPADVGWDPVSGLGTPDFDKLLDVVAGANVARNAQNGATRTWVISPLLVFAWTFGLSFGLIYGLML